MPNKKENELEITPQDGPIYCKTQKDFWNPRKREDDREKTLLRQSKQLASPVEKEKLGGCRTFTEEGRSLCPSYKKKKKASVTTRS